MLRCQCPADCPSVCDGSALAYYIANLGFKFRSHFTAHSAAVLLAVLLSAAVLLAGGSSRAMLASARSLVLILCVHLMQVVHTVIMYKL